MKQPISIVFFGAGPVAAESLAALSKAFSIELVITKPRPAHHRGFVPTLELAEKLQLPLLTVQNSQQLTRLLSKHSLQSKLGVVVDFGIIISAQVIDSFALGIINSHFSLLPQWRGPDPITAAILSGKEETGVSLMKIVPKLDEGSLIAQQEYKLTPHITIAELTKDLIGISNQMLTKYLPLYITGQLKPYPQPKKPATYTEKLTKKDGVIDWRKPAEETEREIRAYLGWPGSRAKLNNVDCIITAAHVTTKQGKPGDIFVEGKEFGVFCAEDSLCIDRIKPAGKKEMSGSDFILGYLHSRA